MPPPAMTDEQRPSVSQLIAFFDKRCPGDKPLSQRVIKRNAAAEQARIDDTADASEQNDQASDAATDDTGVDDDASSIGASATRGRTAIPTAKPLQEKVTAVAHALAPSMRLRQLAALSGRITANVVAAVRRVCLFGAQKIFIGDSNKINDSVAASDDPDDDRAFQTLLRLAIEMNEARARESASLAQWRADQHALNAVYARVQTLKIDRRASATARRFHTALAAIATATNGEDMDEEIAYAWL